MRVVVKSCVSVVLVLVLVLCWG